MSAIYTVVSVNDDGRVDVESMSEETLLKRITPDEHGTTYYGTAGFISQEELNRENDPQYWGKFGSRGDHTKLAIIKGGVVVPQATTVVKAYKL